MELLSFCSAAYDLSVILVWFLGCLPLGNLDVVYPKKRGRGKRERGVYENSIMKLLIFYPSISLLALGWMNFRLRTRSADYLGP